MIVYIYIRTQHKNRSFYQGLINNLKIKNLSPFNDYGLIIYYDEKWKEISQAFFPNYKKGFMKKFFKNKRNRLK